jgi:pyridoxamine 5'-phosphate oxidase
MASPCCGIGHSTLPSSVRPLLPCLPSAQTWGGKPQAWGNLSDKAREQFYWDSPNVPYSGAPSVPSGGRDNAGAMLPAPDTFLLMLLWPRSVKYLRLTDNFAQEDVLDANNQWSCARVNP